MDIKNNVDLKAPLVLSVGSGKGGVGKTNLAVNLACCLARAGKRVVLLDTDLGLANVDVLLGLTPPKNLFYLFHEKAKLQDILFPTPYGFSILPATSGSGEMAALDQGQKLELLESMDYLEGNIDYLLVDTGAGINDNVIYFNLAVQERIIVMTPEPTALTDAYALIKVLKTNHGVEHFKIVLNMMRDIKSSKEVFSRLHAACDHFLDGISLDLAGVIPKDPAIRKAVTTQVPFCFQSPDSPASKAVRELAGTINNWDVPRSLDGNIKFFWKKLLFQQ